LPPPKPKLPPPKELDEELEEESFERAKATFANPLNPVNPVVKKVHKKTSLQSNRVIPNDDLVLNQARRQKSFAGPSAKKIAQLKYPGDHQGSKVNLQRASSMVNLVKNEDIVKVRSLVEVEDYDGNYDN
jgi:hypothetical protein